MDSPVYTSLLHVSLTGVAIALPVALGLFASVPTETSLDHYAEKPWPSLQNTMPLPANTLVNVGYIIIGLFWLYRLNVQDHHLDVKDKYMANAFCWMAILYGHVQGARLISFNHKVAVLDQWYTLPIFSWVVSWSLHILYGWNPRRTILITVLSSASYCLALLHPQGFDIALAVHICCAIYIALAIYTKYPSTSSLHGLLLALLCCSGFVGLKLLDHTLAEMHPYFSVLSGHFWSKVADALQFHFVITFFLSILKTVRERKAKCD